MYTNISTANSHCILQKQNNSSYTEKKMLTKNGNIFIQVKNTIWSLSQPK